MSKPAKVTYDKLCGTCGSFWDDWRQDCCGDPSLDLQRQHETVWDENGNIVSQATVVKPV